MLKYVHFCAEAFQVIVSEIYDFRYDNGMFRSRKEVQERTTVANLYSTSHINELTNSVLLIVQSTPVIVILPIVTIGM